MGFLHTCTDTSAKMNMMKSVMTTTSISMRMARSIAFTMVRSPEISFKRVRCPMVRKSYPATLYNRLIAQCNLISGSFLTTRLLFGYTEVSTKALTINIKNHNSKTQDGCLEEIANLLIWESRQNKEIITFLLFVLKIDSLKTRQVCLEIERNVLVVPKAPLLVIS